MSKTTTKKPATMAALPMVQQTIGFFDLPPEVRNKIYFAALTPGHYVATHEAGHATDHPWAPRFDQAERVSRLNIARPPGLVAASRKTEREALAIWIERNGLFRLSLLPRSNMEHLLDTPVRALLQRKGNHPQFKKLQVIAMLKQLSTSENRGIDRCAKLQLEVHNGRVFVHVDFEDVRRTLVSQNKHHVPNVLMEMALHLSAILSILWEQKGEKGLDYEDLETILDVTRRWLTNGDSLRL